MAEAHRVRRLVLSTLLALALLPGTGAALGATGGATAPEGTPPSSGAPAEPEPTTPATGRGSGGARAGAPARRRRSSSRDRPVLNAFALAPDRAFHYGAPAHVLFSIGDRSRTVRVRLEVRRAGSARVIARLDLGTRRTRARHRATLNPTALPAGRLRVRIFARDPGGRALRRRSPAASTRPLEVRGHRFPIAGRFTYADAGGRFGAPRSGQRHQGQDLSAAEGTPLVAVRGGTVQTVAYQAAGAGHYIILDGDGEDRDYAYMHLQSGSIRVRQGQRVRTGQRLAGVGNTGRSFGAHLHFEVWSGGGWYSGGRPIDPLALLRAWDAWS